MSRNVFTYLSDQNTVRVSPSMSNISEEVNGISNMKTSAPEALDSSSSFYYNKESAKSTSGKNTRISTCHKAPLIGDHEEDNKRKNNRLITKVVYPFALVKPGGIEGDITIKDINERILMTPTKRVRHPVGDFACRPCISAHGTGLSGKAVVALTIIHTQGRGTVTIIRTKG